MFKNFRTKKALNEQPKNKSREFNPPTIAEAAIIDDSRFEDIIKTTDSMNVMITRNSINETGESLLLKTRESIAQSYELARRRINATYQDLVDSGAYVGVQFLAVQIALLNYEKEWDVKRIEYALNVFVNAIIESLSKGVGVAMTNYIVFETVVYVDKILPVASTTPNFAILINTVVWDELFDDLANANKLTMADRPIIESLVLVLEENVKRGYYVQLNDFIITKISPTMSTLVILFSYDFLIKINKEYKRYMATRKKPTVVIGNELSSMNASLKKIDNQKFREQIQAEDRIEDSTFVPNDDIDELPKEEYLQNFTFELSLAERSRRPKADDGSDETGENNLTDDLEDDFGDIQVTLQKQEPTPEMPAHNEYTQSAPVGNESEVKVVGPTLQDESAAPTETSEEKVLSIDALDSYETLSKKELKQAKKEAKKSKKEVAIEEIPSAPIVQETIEPQPVVASQEEVIAPEPTPIVEEVKVEPQPTPQPIPQPEPKAEVIDAIDDIVSAETIKAKKVEKKKKVKGDLLEEALEMLKDED